MAQRFDVSSLRQTGDPQMLMPPRVSMWNGRGMFTVSDTGLLAFHQPLRLDSHLTWFDRSGNRLGTVGEPNLFFNNLALSPDDRRLAISLRGPTQGEADIYIIDLTRSADTKRLTTDPAPDHDPAWSPDGRDIVFNSSRGGGYRLFQRAADGSGSDELFAGLPVGIVAPAWSTDGKFVIFDAGGHLWLRSVEQGSKPVPFGNAGEGETQPSFSPDGRWVVYRSRRTGRSEIYVRPFPSGDRDYKVSLDGGEHPRWRSQGEILFLSLDARIMSARVTAGYTFDSAIPQQLFATGLRRSLLANNRPFDVTRDGQRFILPVTPNVDTTPVVLLTNWTARLRE